MNDLRETIARVICERFEIDPDVETHRFANGPEGLATIDLGMQPQWTMYAFLADAILTALKERGVLGEWRPIETAPKGKTFEDGPRFVAWGTMRGDPGYTEDETKEFFARWHASSREFVLDQPAPRYSGSVTFTRWMPLPQPPREEG